jgi:hypothetical protein
MDSERAKLEMERLADLVRQGVSLPPDQDPEVLRISPLRVTWDWIKYALLVPAAIGLVAYGISRSPYVFGIALVLIFAVYSMRTTKEAWDMLNNRNSHFLLVTRLGFHRVEGKSGGKVVLWPDVDRVLRWQTRDVDLVLVKLKEGKEVEFDARGILYEGGVSRLLRTFQQLGQFGSQAK